jgi:tetratricopeptide (TPR) repeat protein/DNA-binding CsgD family transcriptional regulator
MFKVFLSTCLCLIFFGVKAQTVQELEAKLPSLVDTARVNVLNSLAESYAKTDTAKAFQFINEALQLSQKLEYHEGVATALRFQAMAYYFTDNHEEFEVSLLKSCQYAEEHQCWSILAQNYENLAGMYSSIKGNYSVALDYYLKAYNTYEKYKINGTKYVPLLGIASTYKMQAQYDKALEYINRSLPLIEAANDERNQAIAMENAGEIYWLMHDLPQAKSHYTQALEIFRKRKNPGGQIFSLIGLANVHREANEYAQSLTYGKEALAIGEKFPHYERPKLYGYESVGKTQLAMKNYESSQANFEKALAIGLKLGMIELTRDLYGELAKVAAARNLFKQAYEYQVKFSLYSDSVLNKETSQQLSEARTRFETEKKEAEIEILKRDNQISKFYFVTAVASMLGVIIFGYLIITQQRLKNRKDREVAAAQNQVLEERRALTEAELKNKELSEINLRNELEFKNKELTTHTLNLIQKNESLENIKQLVEEMRLLPDAQLRPKLTNLINTVNYSFNLDRDWDNFKLHFEQVHQGFFEKLMKDYQDLNGNDLKLCALMKLNMESKEIATVLDISPESVKVARHRLRKKLNLATEQNLSSFLASF